MPSDDERLDALESDVNEIKNWKPERNIRLPERMLKRPSLMLLKL